MDTHDDPKEHANVLDVQSTGNASESTLLTELPTFNVDSDPQFTSKRDGSEYTDVDEKSRDVSEVL